MNALCPNKLRGNLGAAKNKGCVGGSSNGPEGITGADIRYNQDNIGVDPGGCSQTADKRRNNRTNCHGKYKTVGNLSNKGREQDYNCHQDPNVSTAEQRAENLNQPLTDTKICVGSDLAQHDQRTDQRDHCPHGCFREAFINRNNGLLAVLAADQGADCTHKYPNPGVAHESKEITSGRFLRINGSDKNINYRNDNHGKAYNLITVEMIRGIAHGLYFIKIQRLQWLHVDPIHCLHQNRVNDQIDHGDGEHAKHPGAFIKCAAEGLHCRVDQSDGHNLRGLECKEEDTGGSNVNTKQSPLYKGIVFIVAANITNGFYQSEEQNVDGRATNKGCSDIGGKEQHYHRP